MKEPTTSSKEELAKRKAAQETRREDMSQAIEQSDEWLKNPQFHITVKRERIKQPDQQLRQRQFMPPSPQQPSQGFSLAKMVSGMLFGSMNQSEAQQHGGQDMSWISQLLQSIGFLGKQEQSQSQPFKPFDLSQMMKSIRQMMPKARDQISPALLIPSGGKGPVIQPPAVTLAMAEAGEDNTKLIEAAKKGQKFKARTRTIIGTDGYKYTITSKPMRAPKGINGGRSLQNDIAKHNSKELKDFKKRLTKSQRRQLSEQISIR